VQYVMRVQVVQEQAPTATPTNVSYSAPDDPSAGSVGAPPLVQAAGDLHGEAPSADAEPAPQQPVVKSEWDKTPRNAPCPCGSGKKYKLCHGAA
jgi:preprotein translocase subunit SecA